MNNDLSLTRQAVMMYLDKTKNNVEALHGLALASSCVGAFRAGAVASYLSSRANGYRYGRDFRLSNRVGVYYCFKGKKNV